MNLHELKTIISRGEDSQHQFKEDIRNGDSLAAEMVAFSNSHGGYIFFGVSNNGDLVGLPSRDVDRINQLISNSASQNVKSPIIIQTENILLDSNRVIIVLTIPEGIDKPYFDNQGVIWLKSGADKRRIHSKEELRRLFQEVDLIHADEVPTRAGVEAINLKQLQDFLTKVYNESLPNSNEERLRLLENMNLSTGKQLNLAGLLLFADKPQFYKPAFIVKAVTFAGTNIGDSYIDSEDFEGPLPFVFQGALSFIMRNLRKIQNQKSVNSIGEPEIPQVVFEELLVNALIHRDYFVSAPIRLFIFEDRIEIINPGNLPDHLTIEKIRAGNSIQRNPILASFIAKGMLPYRGLGTGVRRALQDWPEIQFIDDHKGYLFTSSVARKKVQNAPKNEFLQENAPINALINGFLMGNAPINALKNDLLKEDAPIKYLHFDVIKPLMAAESMSIYAPVNEHLTKLQMQILNIIKTNPTISYESLAGMLQKDPSTIKRNIQKLKSLGVLQRSGSKKKGSWIIIR